MITHSRKTSHLLCNGSVKSLCYFRGDIMQTTRSLQISRNVTSVSATDHHSTRPQSRHFAKSTTLLMLHTMQMAKVDDVFNSSSVSNWLNLAAPKLQPKLCQSVRVYTSRQQHWAVWNARLFHLHEISGISVACRKWNV